MPSFESALFPLARRANRSPARALVCGHRGSPLEAPENTLASFERALAAGADLVEFDVHLSADGEVVVIHDETLDRTTDGKGAVSALPLARLRELDAGSWFSPAFRGERLPSLDETLALLKGRAVPLIEVKAKLRRAPSLGAAVVSALARHAMLEDAVVICREKGRVEEVRLASPRTPMSCLTVTKRQARAASRQDGVSGLDPYWKSLSQRLVRELRERPGFFLTPWTVNRPADQERLLRLGVEAIITDSPRALRSLIDGFDFGPVERGAGEDVDLELLDDGQPSPDAVAAEEPDEN